MEPKDYASIIAVLISIIAFWQSLRRERRASQDSVIKALQGDKEAVMYIAYKTSSPKWQKQLQNATFREEVTTAMCLAWTTESSDRCKALIFAALRRFLTVGYHDSVQAVLKTLKTEFTAYKDRFAPSNFDKRIDAICELAKALK